MRGMTAAVNYNQARISQIVSKALTESQWDHFVFTTPNHQSRQVDGFKARQIMREMFNINPTQRFDHSVPNPPPLWPQQIRGEKTKKWSQNNRCLENFDQV